MRLFIAINMSDGALRALASMQDKMRAAGVRGNYTKTENFHITLAFIGEYPDADLVTDALERVRFKSFDISLDGVGSFGSLWWAGLSSSEELRTLARRVRHALADAGIPFDRKKFSPHITLIRQPDKDTIPPLTVPEATMTVDGISLMRSDRGKSGVVYTEISYIKSE